MRIVHRPGVIPEEVLRVIGIPDAWSRSTVFDANGDLIEHPMRTSYQCELRCENTIAILEQHASSISGEDLVFSEGSFVRYTVGQRYSLHSDVLGLDYGRDWTMLLCLQAADKGGATRFPFAKKEFCLDRGDSLVWCNRNDTDMSHEARSIRQGTKILINAWFDVNAAMPKNDN